MNRSLNLVCFSLAAVLLVRPAHGSGFLVSRFGGEHGNVTTEHMSAIYFNPAGLALRSGNRILVEGLFAYRLADYERPVEAIDTVIATGETGTGTPQEVTSANAGKATLQNVLASPFVGVASDLGVPGLGVGLALYVPFGGDSKWDQNQDYEGNAAYPGAFDGVQRWWSIEGSMRAIYVTVAGSYWFPKARLGAGLGLNLVRTELNVVRARNPDGRDDMVNSTGNLQEGRSLVETSGQTVALGAGVLWSPMDDLLIGASYQSQPGLGEMKLEGTLTNRFGLSEPAETPVEIRQSWPDVIRAGVRWRAPKLELRASGEFVRWSTFKRQCFLDKSDPDRKCALKDDDGSYDTDAKGIQANIERDWEDAFGVRVGGSYWISPTGELALGLGYDGNSVPDATMDVSLMDLEKVFVTAGARWQLKNGLALSAMLTQFIYFSRDVPVRSMPLQSPSRLPDAAGHYTQSITVFDLGVEYAF